ncbi:MAG: isoprenylcysteine carboxylmethyltransferase family protein [Bacteroidota bacterium]|nr:isoprenylcysteine carboxylmethyltransferase family protein [Bacteroidota bacterium]
MALQEELEAQGNWLFRYRGIFPLIILLIGTVLYLWTKLYPETFFLRNTAYEIYFESFCLVVSLFGLAIRVYTVGYTPRNTSGRNVKDQVADLLNTTGIYSTVRHPLYLGNFFMWLGPALMTGQFWFVIAFCFFYWIYYERIMFAEEQYLRKKFEATYLDWAKNVPAFIPSFKNFDNSNLTFSWKKVLRNEKNGLVAIFIIFFFFDVAGELVVNERNFNFFIMTCFILSLILYFILKYLKHRTNILEEVGR